MSRSRTRTFAETRPPASRHTPKDETSACTRPWERRGPQLNQTVRHPAPRSWSEWDRPRLLQQDPRGLTARRLWLQRTPACLATGGARQHEQGRREGGISDLGSDETASETWPLQLTTCRQFLCPCDNQTALPFSPDSSGYLLAF